jgi:nitrite reductase/ring-hydroxylating ferredoxin subunit
MLPMAWVDIGSLDDFVDGSGAAIRAGDRSLAVFRLAEEILAIENRCPHRGLPLHDGTLSGASVRCRTHGSCFDLRSGAVERGPASRGVFVYRVDVTAGRVRVEIPG